MRQTLYVNPSDEVFTEGFLEKHAEKKERKIVAKEIQTCMSRIFSEMWKLFPRTATVFQTAISLKKGKWIPEFAIYMTKDPNHEKPKKESEFSKCFNISKQQMDRLRDVIDRSIEYLRNHSAFDKYDIDTLLVTVYFDGSGWYRFCRKSSATANRFKSEMIAGLSEIKGAPAAADIKPALADDTFDDLDALI
jgi:hypothetical protein